ncbi:rifin [Plasmodium reichenowi]|uniref:Rifin n=1 Tax=Plasmodium reichenowi TaxID=5854 RepID=A0A060RRJ8_PLARE|nr:rifin [Plasmodium reichenowi]
MKLHYTKILLLFLLVTILAHNKNKIYITPHHTPICTLRVLSECDIQSSNYDKDADIKSVKENFDRQTSQRFEEYQERMKDKRQKSKEQREKNIQKIIEKDKMDKSLAEKIEKGCLRCGCGLGGVAASVGIFGTVAVNELTKAAISTAMVEGEAAAQAAGNAARIPAAIKAVIEGIETEFGVSTVGVNGFQSLFTANTYNNVKNIANAINTQYSASSCLTGGSDPNNPICLWLMQKHEAAEKIRGNVFSTYKSIEAAVRTIVSDAQNAAETAAQQATENAIKASTAVVQAKYSSCQTAIIASVVAILVIVLVMIIIYLVLRYRRKKKMNKKAQYTKLLNE